jgi:3-hydroxypropanoate dehydrogenase
VSSPREPGKIVNDEALDVIFRDARTHNAWLDKDVSDTMLHALWELAKMPPTSANCSPARVLFLKSREAKERLRPALSEGNLEKTMAAPVTAIVAYDLDFYEHLPKLFPHNQEARSWFAGKDEHIRVSAVRNGTLQGGYLILAARALGLDCGPMSGFDNAIVDAEFFGGTQLKSNFLCNIGYGDPKALFPRSPRFSFDEACRIL